MRYIKIFLLIIILSLSALHGVEGKKDAIIFDLGGVLIETDSIAAWWQTGPTKWLRYYSSFNSPHNIRGRVYQFLEKLPYVAQESGICAYDEANKALPPIMRDWLAGHITSQQVLSIIDETLTIPHYFTNNLERKLIYSVMHMMFTPNLFIKTRRFVPDGINFVQECKNNGHDVYLLSNWDPESFAYMKTKYPGIFNLFDGIVISGDVGHNKPDASIYYSLLNTYHLRPCNCIFIDDQLINVEAARSLHMKGIVCPQKKGFLSTHPDFNAVRKELDHLSTVN